MTYDIAENWNAIIALLERAKQSNKYATIATNGADGFPNVAPIGFIFPNGIGRVFYFDEYATQTSRNIEKDNRVTIQLVNSAPLFWVGFLLKGKFKTSPGLRLKGFAGAKRKATETELKMLDKRLEILSKTKGAKRIWTGLEFVRDIEINTMQPVHYPKVTDNLWKQKFETFKTK